MKPSLSFLVLAAFGNALYHIGQKSMPPAANPMVLLMVVYAIAFLLTGLAAPFFPNTPSLAASVSSALSWPILALAFGVALVEVGFLLAYRLGGSLQWYGAAVNGLTVLILVPVAILVFREAFSPMRLLGVATTLVGLVLMTRN